jgi:hypothetical protein
MRPGHASPPQQALEPSRTSLPSLAAGSEPPAAAPPQAQLQPRPSNASGPGSNLAGLASHGSIPQQQQQHMPPPGGYAYPPYAYPSGVMMGYPGYSAPGGMRQGYYGQEAQYAAMSAYGQQAYYRTAYPYAGYYVAAPYAMHPGVMQVRGRSGCTSGALPKGVCGR